MNKLRKILIYLLVLTLTIGTVSNLAHAEDSTNESRINLLLAIIDAKTFNNETLVGTIGGRYSQSAKNEFALAIASVEDIVLNEKAKESELNDALETLIKAKNTYTSKRIPAAWDPYMEYIPDAAPIEKRHLRATWISTVTNLDWPTKESTRITDTDLRVATQKAELIKILDEAVELKLNAVILQVRPTSDALFQSDLAPWSYFLTSSLNGDPGFDPLEFAVEEAHNRNLELHAWFNPYRVSMPASIYGLSNLDEVAAMLSNEPKSVYAQHPDWVKIAQNRYVLDPGIPEAREYVEDSIMEVVDNYDIDAVHFDDYFYVGTTGSDDGINDTDTYELYNNGEFTNIKDWRRGNTQQLVENLSEKIKQSKPWVKFGISPAGVWRNKLDDPLLGSETKAGIPNYDHAYADTRKWVLDNTIDYICPQIYWTFSLTAAPYGVIAQWWSELISDHPETNAQLYIGQALYRFEPTEAGGTGADPYWDYREEEGYREFDRQLKYNLARPEISGSVLFRHADIRLQVVQPIIDKMKNETWSSIALVPRMPQLGGIEPSEPVLESVTPGEDGNQLVWSNTESSDSELALTKYYAIYRVPSDMDIDIDDASNIIALVKHADNEMEYVDQSGNSGHKYAITALNRLHDESALSNAVAAWEEHEPEIPVILQVITPSNASVDNEELIIKAAVPYSTSSITPAFMVSEGAGWRLYADANCNQELESIVLAVGINRAFVKVTAENNNSIYTLEITRQSNSSLGSASKSGGFTSVLVAKWILDSKGWWYKNSDGTWPASDWKQINNRWYYFNGDGYMVTDWVLYKNQWYYLSTSGNMIENDWVFYKNKWYYLGTNGEMAAAKWLLYHDNWYYLGEDGAMLSSTVTPDGYTVGENGAWQK